MKYRTDYYRILGIREDADKKTVKKAYKKLALKYHPDVNKTREAERKFKKINEAYSILSDDEKRRKYDAKRSKLYKSADDVKTEKKTGIVKKESSIRKHRRKRSKNKRKSNISKYVNLATRLEEDYGLISGLVGLAVNSGRSNSPAKQGISTLLNSKTGHGKGRRRHRYERKN